MHRNKSTQSFVAAQTDRPQLLVLLLYLHYLSPYDSLVSYRYWHYPHIVVVESEAKRGLEIDQEVRVLYLVSGGAITRIHPGSRP